VAVDSGDLLPRILTLLDESKTPLTAQEIADALGVNDVSHVIYLTQTVLKDQITIYPGDGSTQQVQRFGKVGVTPELDAAPVANEPGESVEPAPEPAPAPASEPTPEPATDTIRFISYQVNDDQDRFKAQRQIADLVAAGWQIKSLTGDLYVTTLLINLPKSQPQQPQREERAAAERPARPAFVKIPRQEENFVSSFVLNGIGRNSIPDLDLDTMSSAVAARLLAHGQITDDEYDSVCARELRDTVGKTHKTVEDKFTPITALKGKGFRREPAAARK
jgi:hypothetical protein